MDSYLRFDIVFYICAKSKTRNSKKWMLQKYKFVPHYQHKIRISWPVSKWQNPNLSVNLGHRQPSRGLVNRHLPMLHPPTVSHHLK
ncbi:hypothetical protein ACROYT_G037003 [Oculina patagonica]